jgi:hypothetical protein
MFIARASKLLFIGNSITEAGRSDSGEATPWDLQRGYGRGYVAFVQASIESTRPADFIRVVNNGISGSPIVDLKARSAYAFFSLGKPCLW